MVVQRYEFYLSKILFLTRENKIHIFKLDKLLITKRSKTIKRRETVHVHIQDIRYITFSYFY